VVWLPLAVASAGAVSLATLWATREQRFSALAASRVLQYGGAALAQAAAGALGWGVTGLVVAPIAATLLATLALRLPLGNAGLRWDTLAAVARRHRQFPLLNTPHAFLGALQDTASVALIAASLGPAAAGFWGLSLRYLKAPATLVGSAVSQALYPKLAAAGRGPRRRRARPCAG
jgi:O-antigen/teichoic acid export membrane protein